MYLKKLIHNIKYQMIVKKNYNDYFTFKIINYKLK